MRTITKIIGAVVAAGAVVWSARDRFIQVPTEPGEPEIPTFRRQQPTGQLTDITGIGPVYRERLSELGIDNVGTLAVADPDRIAEKLGVGKERVKLWIENAAELN